MVDLQQGAGLELGGGSKGMQLLPPPSSGLLRRSGAAHQPWKCSGPRQWHRLQADELRVLEANATAQA